ncbi:MAG TPA: argininosuccinate lyase, partial [Clostridiales bacterium]|nr:argininosuccinate lyase [Clostridiales bacterium]
MEKLWAGRFSKELDQTADDFNSSILFDSRMYRQDIQGSIEHAAMLAKQNIISSDDCRQIVSELLRIQKELEEGTLSIDPNAEDIHMFIESVLTKRIGDAGKRLHTARSRNDQVA